MSPPSTHQAARRRAELIVEREYQPDPARCVRAVLALLAPRRPAEPPATDIADHRRPLRAGDQPVQHNDRASRPRDCAAVAEDDRRERATPIAD